MNLFSRQQEAILTGFSTLILLIFSFLPFLYLSQDLFTSHGFKQTFFILSQATIWILLGKTIFIAASVTFLSLIIGIFIGGILAKTDVFGRKIALFIHGFPFFLPPFLIALGWFHIFGRNGFFGSSETSRIFFSEVGLILLLGLTFSPVISSLTIIGLRNIEPNLEEAAICVASPRKVFTKILLPLSWPSIVFGSLLVFILALSELGVPMFLRVRTYPIIVFARLGGINFAVGEAFALVFPLLIVAFFLIIIERYFIQNRSFTSLFSRKKKTIIYPLGRLRIPISILIWLIIGGALLPIAALAIKAGKNGFLALPNWIGSSLFVSITISFISATIISALGSIIGYQYVRKKWGSNILDNITMLSFVTPAAVLGVGLVATWNHPKTHFLYSTTAILIIGLVARYAIIGSRTFASIFYHTSKSYEEAAAIHGASFFRRFFRIVLPMHKKGIFATWLLAVAFCLRDLETLIIFYPPGLETLPIRIFTLEANGPQNVVAALAITHVLVTAFILFFGFIMKELSDSQ